MFDSVRAGMKLGMKLIEQGSSTPEALKSMDFELFDMHLKPVEGNAVFPSHIINEKTGENMLLEIRNGFVFFTQKPDTVATHIYIIKILNLIFPFLMLALFIYLPIKTFRIMRSISKEEFYTIKNINNLRYVSFALLAMYLIHFTMNLANSFLFNYYVQIKGYESQLVQDFNYAFLSLGLVLLILSEILRYTTRIKEENDLTV
jgi:hypothetical protein